MILVHGPQTKFLYDLCSVTFGAPYARRVKEILTGRLLAAWLGKARQVGWDGKS